MELQGTGVVVFCGSSMGSKPAYAELARQLGASLATAGARLVYGGASVGLMGQIADAALAAGGEVHGVIPRALVDREISHQQLTRLEVVETMHERKALMNQWGSAFVALPGGFGTLEEALEILTWKQMGLHKKPVVLINHEGYWNGLLAQIETSIASGFMNTGFAQYFSVAADAQQAMMQLQGYEPPPTGISKWD